MTTKCDEPGDVEKVIFDGLAEVGAEPDEISREAEFEALDVDSLDLVELAQIVEEEFGVRLEGDDAEGLTTVGRSSTSWSESRMTRPSSITGGGAVTPLGVGAETLLDALDRRTLRHRRRRGPLRGLRPRRLPEPQGGASRRPLHAARAWSRPTRRSRRPARQRRRSTRPRRLRDRHRHRRPHLARGAGRRPARAGPEAVSPCPSRS